MTGAAIAHNASYTQVFDRLPVAAQLPNMRITSRRYASRP